MGFVLYPQYPGFFKLSFSGFDYPLIPLDQLIKGSNIPDGIVQPFRVVIPDIVADLFRGILD